ncbi:MAG: ABC transporter substrate-binding protein [Nitrospirae bacterium]|nr:MAG: ABC transporter substrate-binding protein [Nitrospirota bacterium]
MGYVKNGLGIAVMAAVILLGAASADTAWAGPPTDALKQTIDEVIKILEDPGLKKLDKKKDRRVRLEEVVGHRFNYAEMAKRTLGKEWAKRSPEEQKEFVASFQTLLVNTYIGRIENYSGEKVQYLKETTDGDYAEVKTQIDTGKSIVPIDYKMHNNSGEWRVYDVVVEGTGLVQNYREQFRRIINKESFEALAQQLREKAKGIDAP